MGPFQNGVQQIRPPFKMAAVTNVSFGNRILCSGLRCLNPAIGQCGDNGSGIMTGVPLKSEFLFFICVIIVMCHSKIQTKI